MDRGDVDAVSCGLQPDLERGGHSNHVRGPVQEVQALLEESREEGGAFRSLQRCAPVEIGRDMEEIDLIEMPAKMLPINKEI